MTTSKEYQELCLKYPDCIGCPLYKQCMNELEEMPVTKKFSF